MKTKAKSRYLKAKKERRKKRKTVAPAGGAPPAETSIEHSDEDPDENVAEDRENPDHRMEVEPTSTRTKPSEKRKEKRVKKRRKVEPAEGEDAEAEIPIDVDNEEKGEQEEMEPISNQSEGKRSPTPQVTLPLFPPPRQPDAPSKSTLALQGLDQALVEAELIDPRTTIPVSDDLEGIPLGLTEKMRQRLKDLGISELFAGVFLRILSTSEWAD